MADARARAAALSLSLGCRTIGVRRPALARWLSQLCAAVLVAAPLTVVAFEVARHLDLRWFRDMVDEVATPLLWAWVVATPSLALLSVLMGAAVPARAGHLVVDAAGVRASCAGSAWLFRAPDIVAGLVLPTLNGPAVELYLADGRVFRAVIEGEHEAYAVLDRLGIGPERRRVAVALGSSNRSLAAGCVAFPVAAILWLVVLGATAPFGWTSRLNGAAWMLFVAVSTLLVRRAAAPPEITIGTDGVLIRRWWGARLVPFAEIDRVSRMGTRLCLDLRPPHEDAFGDRIVVRGSDAALAAGLADRLSDAMNIRRGTASAAVAVQLDPTGRPLAEWREALGKLLKGGANYRRAALGADDLLAVLDDASAPPARRIGAALALRDGAHPEARARVRIAADTCADEDVRAALEAAAEEEIDEAPIRRVLGG